MKTPKLSPSYPTLPILIFGVIMGLFLLVVGICNIAPVREALATGQAYTVGIILDDTTMIYRSNSPGEYWVMIGIYFLGTTAMIGFGIWMPIFVIIDYGKKLARLQREKMVDKG